MTTKPDAMRSWSPETFPPGDIVVSDSLMSGLPAKSLVVMEFSK